MHLPKLIADAISGASRGARSTSIFHQSEKDVLLNFWRGAAGALQWRAQAGSRTPVMTNDDVEDEDDES